MVSSFDYKIFALIHTEKGRSLLTKSTASLFSLTPEQTSPCFHTEFLSILSAACFCTSHLPCDIIPTLLKYLMTKVMQGWFHVHELPNGLSSHRKCDWNSLYSEFKEYITQIQKCPCDYLEHVGPDTVRCMVFSWWIEGFYQQCTSFWTIPKTFNTGIKCLHHGLGMAS